MSSRSLPSEAVITAASTRSTTASGGSPAHVSSKATELPVAEDLLAAPPDLGDAIRVEHEHLAGAERDRDVGQHRLDVRAEQRAEPPDRGDASVRVTTSGSGCPPHASSTPDPVVADAQVGVTDGAKAALVTAWSRSARCRSVSTPDGRLSYAAAARIVWRASAVTAAASGPLPWTSPISAVQAPSAAAKRS